MSTEKKDKMSGMGVASVFGTMLSGLFNQASQDSAQSHQSYENRLNRLYNQSMAQQANNWSIQQWNRENAYNDPSAQKARLVSAGLNPDLMYSNGTSSLMAATSPSVTPTPDSSPMDYSPYANSPIGSAIGQAIAQAAQIKNLEANTKKTEAETDSTKQDTEFKAQLQSGNIVMQGLQIQLLNDEHELKDLTKGLTKEQITNMRQQTENLRIQSDKLQAEIEQVRTSIAGMKLDNKQKETALKYLDETLSNQLESLKLDVQQKRTLSKYYSSMLAEQLLGLQRTNEKTGAEIANLRKQGLILSFDQGITKCELDKATNEAFTARAAQAGSVCAKIYEGLRVFLKDVGQVLGGNVGLVHKF